jgi:threonine synthase
MRYYSTKNRHRFYSLEEAVLLGLPEDNGLFMPESIPALDESFIRDLHGKSLVEIAEEVSEAWFGKDVPSAELKRMVQEAFPFDTPLVKLDDYTHVLELFHGPTLAFKDVGARFMARLMSWMVRGSDRKLTILVATSGDTGSAVASGFFGVPGIEVVILYPSGKVSDSQEKQLTTWGGNIRALEVKGTFDDCQRMVKEAFLDAELRSSLRLTSANSINIARLVPQSFYYFRAAAQLPEDAACCFVVPSGNFGNLTAGLLAKRMGLSVAGFVAATNLNDVVPTYLSTGDFKARPSVSTLSNAMDVGNPSNFWRMTELYQGSLEAMVKDIAGCCVTEEETVAAMRDCHDRFGYIIDPHGAVGYHAWMKKMRQRFPDTHGVVLETAHPAKFGNVVKDALGLEVVVPERLATIIRKEKNASLISPSLIDLKAFLLSANRS